MELLAPAGDFERLEAALLYGADAVYLAGQEFGMRASQTNFTEEELVRAVSLCHEKHARLYLTVNTLPRNDEFERLPEYLRFVMDIGVDALIVTDLGVLSLIKECIPKMEVHISTQAGVVNYRTALAFYQMGAKRVVLARELSLAEIAEIREKTPADLELEAFVHGAMCMSFSGRCLLSNYLTGRDANRGECAQPCRWSYHLTEEKRPNQFFPIYEDEKGSYILNAQDLCMLEHIDKLAQAGISSFKIEGRAKSSYYVSAVTNAYRIAMDSYLKAPGDFRLEPWLGEEVKKVSHRRYCTGFYFGEPAQYYENGGYVREWDVVAIVNGCEKREDGGFDLLLTQKNKFSEEDELELLEPGVKPVSFAVVGLRTEAGEPIKAACHPLMKLRLRGECSCPAGAILRKQNTK